MYGSPDGGSLSAALLYAELKERRDVHVNGPQSLKENNDQYGSGSSQLIKLALACGLLIPLCLV